MYMTYKELSAEQERPLDHKIEKAVEALARGFAVSKHTCALAFSGGKDREGSWELEVLTNAAISRARKGKK